MDGLLLTCTSPYCHLPTAAPPCRDPWQALTYLGTVWSVNIKSRLHFRAVSHLADATHVKVVPHSFVGTNEMVPLHGKQTVRPGPGPGRAWLFCGSRRWQKVAGGGHRMSRRTQAV